MISNAITIFRTLLVKIVAAFAALTLLIAPAFFAQQQMVGVAALWIAAALTVLTVVGYWMAALKAFRET